MSPYFRWTLIATFVIGGATYLLLDALANMVVAYLKALA